MSSRVGARDVVIIGGGPAGSTAASLLAMQGLSVTVLEKERFPRQHVGESLLPWCYDIFGELGVLERMKERFERKPGVRFIDTDGSRTTTWCFEKIIHTDAWLSFHVRRDEFDLMLLERSGELGVDVRQETRVTGVDLDGPEGDAIVRAVDADGRRTRLRARFLIDASGRDTFLAKRNRWKRPHEELDRAALSTHWTNPRMEKGLAEGLLQIIYLGGAKKGWIWCAPIGENRVTMGVVLNHSYIRDQKKRLAAEGVEDWAEALYRQEVFSSPFLAEVLADAEIAMPILWNGNYSYWVDCKHGPNFALIGDAGAFIDPIFASGVYLSMNSARLVAQTVGPALLGENGDGPLDLAPSYEQINGAYALLNKGILLFYNPESINFAQVSSAAPVISGSRNKEVLGLSHYLMAGDFFEEHERYSGFIDLLQAPGTYEKYLSLVGSRSREEDRLDGCAGRTEGDLAPLPVEELG